MLRFDAQKHVESSSGEIGVHNRRAHPAAGKMPCQHRGKGAHSEPTAHANAHDHTAQAVTRVESVGTPPGPQPCELFHARVSAKFFANLDALFCCSLSWEHSIYERAALPRLQGLVVEGATIRMRVDNHGHTTRHQSQF
jgi:hypothetical protein